MAQINEQAGVRLFDATDVNTLAQGQGYHNAQAIVATGTTRTDAAQLPLAAVQRIDTSSASTGVILPSAASPGWFVMLANNSGQTIATYAQGSDTVNGTAGSTGVTFTNGQAALFFCPVAGKIYRVLTA